jgi:hypothetical protein
VSDAPVGDPAGGVLLEQIIRNSVPPERLAISRLTLDRQLRRHSALRRVSLTRHTTAAQCRAVRPTEVPDLVCSLDVLPITGSGQAPRGGYAEEEDPELSAT